MSAIVAAACPAARRYVRHQATVRWRGRGGLLWHSHIAERAAGDFSLAPAQTDRASGHVMIPKIWYPRASRWPVRGLRGSGRSARRQRRPAADEARFRPHCVVDDGARDTVRPKLIRHRRCRVRVLEPRRRHGRAVRAQRRRLVHRKARHQDLRHSILGRVQHAGGERHHRSRVAGLCGAKEGTRRPVQ